MPSQICQIVATHSHNAPLPITRHMGHVSHTGYCQLVVRHVRYGHSRGGPQSSVLLVVIHPDFCRISIDNFLTEFLLMIHVMCTFNSILLHVICCFLSRCLCEPHDSVLVRSVHSYIPDQAAVIPPLPDYLSLVSVWIFEPRRYWGGDSFVEQWRSSLFLSF